MKDVALVSLPWVLYDRPSIQLGVLKAFLDQRGIQANCFHLHLRFAAKLGYQVYRDISREYWIAESIASSLLFPEMNPDITTFCKKLCKKLRITPFNFDIVKEQFNDFVTKSISSINFEEYKLIGISACSNQLTTSLFFAKRLKLVYPKIEIVFGGSNCTGDLGASLLRNFPYIDFVVNGEGERPLLELIKNGYRESPIMPKGVLYRKRNKIMGKGINQIRNIDDLPRPAYLEYFKDLYSLVQKEKRFNPLIPLEFGRGCFWNRCNFCNLNFQWQGYRRKSVKNVLNSICFYTELFGSLNFCFVDNVLPEHELRLLFDSIAEKGRDYLFLGELRANTNLENVRYFSACGLKRIQVGIEALSSGLLEKMNKGTRVIDNIAIMKECLENEITLSGNIILHFPGSNENDVGETLKNLRYARYFPALKPNYYYLAYLSPVFNEQKKFGINKIFPHHHYRHIFPRTILKDLKVIYWAYNADLTIQRRIWKPVEREIKEWHSYYLKASKDGPPLSYIDGGSFLIIKQIMDDYSVRYHRLNNIERELYLYCARPKGIEQIRSLRSRISFDKLEGMLSNWTRELLMFGEDGQYLSLAIHYS